MTEHEGLEYHQLFRRGRQPTFSWALLGVLVLAFLFVAVNAVVVYIGWAVATGADQADLDALTATGDVTPSVLLFVSLVIALAIPETWATLRALQGLPPRWLSSVELRVRWGLLAASFAVSFVALVLSVVVGGFLPSDAEAGSVASEPNAFTSTTRDFLLVILFLTPVQALAEEYLFRGYLTQAVGSLFAHRWVARAVAVVVPAGLFALAHGAQDFPVFVDRFAFGLSAGILVIATGGLEAGIAYHVVNNVLAFGITLAYGDITTALEPTGGSWWSVLLTVVKSVVFVGLSILVARRMGVATRTGASELVAPGTRV